MEPCSPWLGVVRPRASDELGIRGHCWRELRLISIALQGIHELGVSMGQEPAGAAVQGCSSPVPSLWSPRGLLSPFDSSQGSSVPALLPGELGSGVLAGLTWSPFCSGTARCLGPSLGGMTRGVLLWVLGTFSQASFRAHLPQLSPVPESVWS